ncbi:MAG: Gar/GrdA family gentamicin resistance ATP-binding protein [Longimicrobiales bacterium]
MIIVLNGPLGIGKSTLGEMLTESIAGCALLDGDRLLAVNPPQLDALEHLHSTIALLVAHHYRFGYRHFVIDYFWRSEAELADLRQRLAHIDRDVRSFLLTLPAEENLRRIELRASARAIDELEFERNTFAQERELLAASAGTSLGEPFDVSAPPAELAHAMLRRLGLR